MTVKRRSNLSYRLQVLLDWSRYQWYKSQTPVSQRDRVLGFIRDAINMEFSPEEQRLVARLLPESAIAGNKDVATVLAEHVYADIVRGDN